MSLPPTVLTALSVERPSRPRIDSVVGGRSTRSQMNETPLILCFPRDDGRFVERVQTLLDGSHHEEPFAAAIQALLRETYPRAVITPRHELAGVDGARVWYVFRDGSVAPAVDGDTS